MNVQEFLKAVLGKHKHPVFFTCPLLEDKYVALFLNPQNITYTLNKVYSEQRSKSGYFIQYWGDNLMELRYEGQTASYGVEGIKQLMVLYRGEQIAMNRNTKIETFTLPPKPTLYDVEKIKYPIKTLSEMLVNVKMHYLGWLFQGYFTNFTFDENIDMLGFFRYSLTMRVTSFKNFSKRINIFPWQTRWDNSDWIENVAESWSSLEPTINFEECLKFSEDADAAFVVGGR